jgi:hypothetical protein
VHEGSAEPFFDHETKKEKHQEEKTILLPPEGKRIAGN